MTAQDRRVSKQINDLRRAAGHPMTECPTCGRSADNPYRRYHRDKLIQGCVDAYHTDALPKPSISNSWHESHSACLIREAVLRDMTPGLLRSKRTPYDHI